MSPETRWIIDWISRMAHRYGGTVYDDETGKTWDWGQALCRERFGPEWMKTAAFAAGEAAGQPFAIDVAVARAWEEGDWPSWARPEKRDAPLARS